MPIVAEGRRERIVASPNGEAAQVLRFVLSVAKMAQGRSDRIRLTLLFAAVIAAVSTTAAPGSARPGSQTTTVSCGQRLTRSTTLANDLVNCPHSGLIVGAGNIVINLNGHTIDGTNAHEPGTGGIKSEHTNVTIENGTITDFYFSGVDLGPRNIARKLTVRKIGAGCKRGDICAGIFLFKASGSRITNCVVSNDVRAFQVSGIDVYNSPGTVVERSRLLRNAGEGIAFFGSPGTRVIGNEFDGNRNGMDANNGSDSITVSGNHARGNRLAGIAIGALGGARVLGNVASGNGDDGLFLFNLRNSVARDNRASGNFTGIHLYGGRGGVAQYGGKHGAKGNRLIGNSATKNSHAGIWVKGDDRRDSVDDNLISGNVASRNGHAGGIAVQASARGNRLRRNAANSNAGHGITAVRGTIDAGGNRAHGNRRPPQCVGVACS
jgi:parallel beta-helix repeat protein